MEYTVVNGSVHTAHKQHQRVCVQMCLHVLCERALPRSHHKSVDALQAQMCSVLWEGFVKNIFVFPEIQSENVQQ